MSTISRARPGGAPFVVDGKRVTITIGNGSGVEAMRGQLVSKSANLTISDTLSIMLLAVATVTGTVPVHRDYTLSFRFLVSKPMAQ